MNPGYGLGIGIICAPLISAEDFPCSDMRNALAVARQINGGGPR